MFAVMSLAAVSSALIFSVDQRQRPIWPSGSGARRRPRPAGPAAGGRLPGGIVRPGRRWQPHRPVPFEVGVPAVVAAQVPLFFLAADATGWALRDRVLFMVFVFGAVRSSTPHRQYVDDRMRSRVAACGSWSRSASAPGRVPARAYGEDRGLRHPAALDGRDFGLRDAVRLVPAPRARRSSAGPQRAGRPPSRLRSSRPRCVTRKARPRTAGEPSEVRSRARGRRRGRPPRVAGARSNPGTAGRRSGETGAGHPRPRRGPRARRARGVRAGSRGRRPPG